MAQAPLLKYPFPGQAPASALPPRIRNAPALESYSREQGLLILASVRNTVAGAKVVIEFARVKRDLARQAGIEIVCVEMLAIMEGECFQRVVDAVDELGESGAKSLYLTREGVAGLRAMEGLLAEAQSNIRRFTGLGLEPPIRAALGSSDDPAAWWVPMVIFSIVVIAGIVIASSVKPE